MASAARLPDRSAPSSVAASLWSPQTNSPFPRLTGRSKFVGGTCNPSKKSSAL